MKKGLKSFIAIQFVALLFWAAPTHSFAQTDNTCGTRLKEFFGGETSQKPVLLRRLGTSPQFGEIPQHTAKSAYDHLKKVHTRNMRNSRAEIDRYLKVLGYTGFNDPAFTVDKIVPVVLPKGKIGWMGAYYQGHRYKWSVLGNPFPSFKILSKDGGCHSYIMKKCGNAFFDPTEIPECEPCTPCDPNYGNKTLCPECETQELSFAGTGSIKAGDVVNMTKTFPIVATYNGRSLCVGEQTVPVRLTYELSADGSVDYASTFQVCDYGSEAPTNLNMPVMLSYAISGANVTLGEALEVPLTKKQFNKMKRIYNECPSDIVSSSVPAAPVLASAVNNFSEASPIAPIKDVVNPLNCVRQTVTLSGNGEVTDAAYVSSTQAVTVIGKYIKEGKLKKGETADKYRCMGTYSLPANSLVEYNLTGNSKIQTILEVCDTGDVNPNEEISVPMTLNAQISQSDVMIGDYGKIYVPLTKQEYKRISKIYSRCCGDGTTKCF